MKKFFTLSILALLCCSTGTWAEGELNGVFSVSSTKKVLFSKGNLQYVDENYQFAEHQYDYFGGNQYSNHVDMFANNGYSSPDGDTAWRILSQSEWSYLYTERSVTNTLSEGARYSKATIGGTYKGVIVFPDSYTHPNGTGFAGNCNNAAENYASTVSLEGWALMEAAGCVFLPAAGYKNDNIRKVDDASVYDSSTANDDRSRCTPGFYSNEIKLDDRSYNTTCVPVRLVKDVAIITTAPVVIQELTYTGSAQTLITAGEASGGTMYYSLDGSSWGTSLPTGINWGTYTVYYKVVGDASHADNPGGILTAIIGKAPSYGTTVGPWTFDDVRTGWTGYSGAGTSFYFNGLNDTKWSGNTYRYNDTDGCGYAYLGSTTINSKYAVFSTYTHTENVPSYTRKVLAWSYQLASWSSWFVQTTALYAADNLAYLKILPVDFTEDYTDGSGSAYHLVHLTQETAWGAETSEQTGWFGFDNRSGSTAADKTSALLLTQVIGDNTGVSNYVHNWGSFKHVSSSWTTYYYKHITFNANGGSGNMAQQTVENSSTLTANTFTRAGYSFAGWATTENGDVVYADGAEITATSEDKGLVTLYAKWTANTKSYTVPSSGIGTFSDTYNFTVPDGLTAYYCKTYDKKKGTISVVAINGPVPANTGVLLKGTPNETYTLTGTNNEAATVTDNALVAVTEATHVEPIDDDYTNFMLKSGTFITIANSEESVKMPANKAYLQILTSQIDPDPASARAIRLSWGGVTSIHNSQLIIHNYALPAKRIVKGKLIIEKNGQMFNANGQLIK